MSDMRNRQQEIEEVRTRLHQLVTDKQGDFGNPEVATLSTHLDELIVEYEKKNQCKISKISFDLAKGN
jgi:hypothetical protein